jgi:tRNA G26 N,N-dimethylase Trm1
MSCGKCSELYPDDHYLQMHLKWKHKSKKVDTDLTKTVAVVTKTVANKKQTMTNEKPRMTCNFCQDSFASQKLFLGHVNSIHEKEIENVWKLCKNCRKFFPGKIIAKHN